MLTNSYAKCDVIFAPPLTGMQLASCEVLDGGAVWLRYRLENAPSD